MNDVTRHYDALLAPIYLWMAGGADAAFAQGARELTDLQLTATAGTALDLGAGFGMHSVPLARLGYRVTAVDTSPELLLQLQQLGAGLGIRAVQTDMLEFAAHLDRAQDLILCMTDTLTHLAEQRHVEALSTAVAAALAPGGRFVATFRDYTRPARDDARFILVRSDPQRIQTCFLEEDGDRMRVHDVVHERHEDSWRMRVSHYPKLRLDPQWVVTTLERAGLEVSSGSGPRGMISIQALKPST